MRKTVSLLVTIGAMLLAGNFTFSAILPDEAAGSDRIANAFGSMPLYFIENQGQLADEVGFYTQGYDKALYFTPQGVTFALTDRTGDKGRSRSWVIKLDFVNANPGVRPTGENRQEAVFSYFLGTPENLHSGLRTFSRIVYTDLWPGIDLIYTGSVNMLKYEFMVKPGAEPDRIQLMYRGATNVIVKETGVLAVTTPVASFDDAAPYAYQVIDGQRVKVPMAYALTKRTSEDSFEYGFDVGAYDPTQTLVLDPATVIYCGYIGGSDADVGWGIAVDNDGCAYVTGETYSTPPSFPVTIGPGVIYNGNGDAFVAKIDAAGTGLVYCGYIGGINWDVGYGIDVDGQGSAYVTGYTNSPNFPVIACPFPFMGNGDAFIAKVAPDGSVLVYSGCIGGIQYDEGHDVAVDGDGNAYVTGRANSAPIDGFPVLVGPSLVYSGGGDAFVCKVDAVCAGLVYCGYIGGQGSDEGNGIDVDSDEYAYVTGSTSSDELSFPVTIGPDLTHNGGFDAFVAKVFQTGGALSYCGYIGGADTDLGHDIAVDPHWYEPDWNAYVTGETYSTEATFPVLVGPDLTYNGSSDAFVARVRSLGNGLVYCGYIGGQDKDFGFGIGVDVGRRAYVAGNTWSSEAAGFPVLVGPDLTFNGQVDAFVSRVSASGAALQFSGYVGGSQVDWSAAGAVGPLGNAYTTGEVTSTQATFPVQIGPDLTFNGNQDAFVAKIDCCVTRGDVNGDGAINIADLTYLVNHSFRNGPPPPCFDEGDVNGDGTLNIADLTYMVDYLFRGGPAPPPCP